MSSLGTRMADLGASLSPNESERDTRLPTCEQASRPRTFHRCCGSSEPFRKGGEGARELPSHAFSLAEGAVPYK